MEIPMDRTFRMMSHPSVPVGVLNKRDIEAWTGRKLRKGRVQRGGDLVPRKKYDMC